MAKKNRTIILTGAAGFIGSCFLWKLNREGIDEVIAVDNLQQHCAKWHNLSGKRFRDYIQKDDFLALLESGKVRGIDTIVHMGACSSTLIDDAGYLLKNNYEYSKRLALWADANRARFIYASSAATYGDGSSGYGDEEARLQDLRPLNVYGYTKHLFDLWMSRSGLLKKSAGFKFFNVFGPNEYHKAEMMSVICRRFEGIKSGGPMPLFKSYRSDYRDGEQKRDFVYIKDAIEVIYYFFLNRDKSGIFNLGSGRAHSWNELAGALFLALDKTTKIEYIEMPVGLRERYQYFTQAPMGKLRNAGCRHEFMPLEESVKDYVSYLEGRKYL